jgi:hypothetical protein
MNEGYTLDELLSMGNDQARALAFRPDGVVFRIGSATLLGAFRCTATTLILELAHIEGGVEGVLLTLWALAHRYAKHQCLQQVEWIVHAVSCARPHIKLQRVLERKGFKVEDVPGCGKAYHLISVVRG